MPIMLKRALGLCGLLCLCLTHAAVADEIIGQKNEPPARRMHNFSDLVDPSGPSVEAGRAGFASDLLIGAVPPRPFPLIEYSAAFIDDLREASGDAQWSCLTEALYFEARGESIRGIFAVAEVILNRVDSARFPADVCAVVKQGTGRKFACQFTYTCDGRAEIVREKWAWRRVGKIARLMLDGGARPLTRGALYYHTRAVAPYWSRIFDRTTTIGAHHFYAQG